MVTYLWTVWNGFDLFCFKPSILIIFEKNADIQQNLLWEKKNEQRVENISITSPEVWNRKNRKTDVPQTLKPLFKFGHSLLSGNKKQNFKDSY